LSKQFIEVFCFVQRGKEFGLYKEKRGKEIFPKRVEKIRIYFAINTYQQVDLSYIVLIIVPFASR